MSSFSFNLASSWLNEMLYGLELVIGIYLLVARRVTPLQRGVILAAIAIDTLGTVTVFAIACGSNPNASGDQVFRSMPWARPTLILTNVLSAMLEQGFLSYRYWSLSRNIIIGAFLFLAILTHVSFAFISAIFTAVFPGNHTGPLFGFQATIINHSIGAGTDICVALAMIHALFALTPRGPILPTTKSLVLRISRNCVSCGVATAFFTMLNLILFCDPASLQYSMLTFTSLGRIYSLTLFFNFLVLKRKPGNKSTPTTKVVSSYPPADFATFGLTSDRTQRSNEGSDFTLEPFESKSSNTKQPLVTFYNGDAITRDVSDAI